MRHYGEEFTVSAVMSSSCIFLLNFAFSQAFALDSRFPVFAALIDQYSPTGPRHGVVWSWFERKVMCGKQVERKHESKKSKFKSSTASDRA
jgi:hypothetical protein